MTTFRPVGSATWLVLDLPPRLKFQLDYCAYYLFTVWNRLLRGDRTGCARTHVCASSDVLSLEQAAANVRSHAFLGCISVRMILKEICLCPAIICRRPGTEQLFSGPVSEPCTTVPVYSQWLIP